jgi:5-methylthioribose kinase
VAQAVERIVRRMLGVQEALCHGDYSPKNILTHRQGFTLVDYETAHWGDPTMDLGFFLSHLILKAARNLDLRQRYFDLTRAFWTGYSREAAFRSLDELQARSIEHFGVCILARIDGTSPVDYLPEEPRREAIRSLGRQVLLDRPGCWEDVLALCEDAFASLE